MYVHEGIVKDTLINNDIPFKSKSHNEPIPNARSDKYGSRSGDDFLHNVLSFLIIIVWSVPPLIEITLSAILNNLL